MTRVRDGLVVEEDCFLIRPPAGHDHFDPRNIAIHGIHPHEVAGEPRFLELFPRIQDFIGDDVVVAHNAAFDLGVIEAALRVSGERAPRYRYACTVVLSRRCYSCRPIRCPSRHTRQASRSSTTTTRPKTRGRAPESWSTSPPGREPARSQSCIRVSAWRCPRPRACRPAERCCDLGPAPKPRAGGEAQDGRRSYSATRRASSSAMCSTTSRPVTPLSHASGSASSPYSTPRMLPVRDAVESESPS